MDADGSGAHYGTEEGDLARHGVENILWAGSHGGSLLVSGSEGYTDGKVRTRDFGGCSGRVERWTPDTTLASSDWSHGCSSFPLL
jgi:hypothetical protein